MTGPDAVVGTRLWLVRHGHTVWADTGGVAGRTDVALSERGREAVRALVPTLVGRIADCRAADRSVAWWVSPMSRTRETSSLLREGTRSERASLPDAVEDARLVELDFGDWEGSTWEAVHREHGARLAAWGEDWVDGAPPNGESFRAQAARASAWLDEALVSGTPDHVVVSHGGTIRALLAATLGHPLTEAMRFAVDPASVACVERVAGGSGRQAGWLLRLSNASGFDL